MIHWKRSESTIEMINGKQMIKLDVPKEVIPFYQKEILSLSTTGCFLPIKFVFMNEVCQMYYDCSERVPLEQYLKDRKESGIYSFVEEGIWLLEHLLEQLQQGENHLLFLEDYQLSFDLLFVHIKEKRLELLFLPKKETVDFSDEWKNILTAIEVVINDNQWSIYSQKLIHLQTQQNLGAEELLLCLRDMKRQVSYSN